MVDWKNVDKDFTPELQKEWEEKGFSVEETQAWIKLGLKSTDVDYVWWLRDVKYGYLSNQKAITKHQKWLAKYGHDRELRTEYNNGEYKQWVNIHKNFGSSWGNIYQNEWKKHGFTSQSVKEWINIGFKPSDYYLFKDWKKHEFTFEEIKQWVEAILEPNDYGLATYCRVKGYQPNKINREELEKKYKNWLENSKLAQEYLDVFYPKHKREQIKELNVEDKNLTGKLDCSDFKNLEKLNCYDDKLISLNVSNCSKLINLNCYNNNLTSLEVSNCPQLERLDCEKNQLTNLDLGQNGQLKELCCGDNKLNNCSFLTTLSNPEKLIRIDLRDNNIKQDLTIFSRFSNLESLTINNNEFVGNLEPLKELTKLENLDLSNNPLSGSLMPLKNLTNLEELSVSDTQVNGSLESIKNLTNLTSLSIENAKISGSLASLVRLRKLKKLDISDTDLNKGVEYLPENLSGWGKISYSTYQMPDSKVGEIKWHLDLFVAKTQKNWEELNFSLKEIKSWISSGAKPKDYEFVAWLKNIKNYEPEWVTDYRKDYQILSNRFKKYGLCSECNQPNTGEKWCQSCNASRLEKGFTQWTSNNLKINKFIQKYQLEATDADKFLEWIPYEQFKDIEYLAQGGFGKVYKARWTFGNIHYWDTENNQWQREKDYYYYEEDKNEYDFEWNKDKYKEYKDYRAVVLKSLTNSQENTDFLQETANHKIIDDWFNNIVPCYGISQDPKTGNYLMVMKYIEGGNLRKYLIDKKLKFTDKLQRLTNIIQGLKDVHQKNLVHRDFHSGNILNSEIHSFITDLGLCKPVDEVNKESEIFGVLPYVDPEVLLNKTYTQASDIYSLGIIAYEIFANSSPYLDREHDTSLALDIFQGRRPNLEELKIPQMLKDLIRRCWDADPNKRPNANELERTLRNWQQNTEFVSQLREIEVEYDQFSQKTSYKSHPTAIMTSKLINTKQITQLLQQKVSENFYGSKDLDLDINCLGLDELNIQEEQIEVPSKNK